MARILTLLWAACTLCTKKARQLVELHPQWNCTIAQQAFCSLGILTLRVRRQTTTIARFFAGARCGGKPPRYLHLEKCWAARRIKTPRESGPAHGCRFWNLSVVYLDFLTSLPGAGVIESTNMHTRWPCQYHLPGVEIFWLLTQGRLRIDWQDK